jgi:hypothetical protein
VWTWVNIRVSLNINMSDKLEELEARIALLEKQMINVNREFESGTVSDQWEQTGVGSKPAPPEPEK